MVQIKECREKLVDLRKYCPKVILTARIKNHAYLRESVADKINEAIKFLPKGMTFVINSAWRSEASQITIYKNFWREVKKKNPSWTDQKIKKYVETFVAPWKGKYLSGHMTGGALDVRLWKNGRKIPMRTKKLNYQENSQSHQPKLPKKLIENRKIMFQALEKAGFANCPAEFWHWDYGDIWWAEKLDKKIAIYDKIEKNN